MHSQSLLFESLSACQSSIQILSVLISARLNALLLLVVHSYEVISGEAPLIDIQVDDYLLVKQVLRRHGLALPHRIELGARHERLGACSFRLAFCSRLLCDPFTILSIRDFLA